MPPQRFEEERIRSNCEKASGKAPQVSESLQSHVKSCQRTDQNFAPAGKTRADRRSKRAGIRLKAAVGRILPYLEQQPSSVDLDAIVVEWIEAQWVAGEALTYIADCLSGLHFFWPELRGLLRQAWRMFKQWRRIETPTRAPPMTAVLARAFVARAVATGNLRFAALIAIGFHSLLRTGELLALSFKDLEISSSCGVVSLDRNKTGWRTGSKEAIALRDRLTLQLLDVLLSAQSPPGEKVWPHSAQKFGADFQRMCIVSHFLSSDEALLVTAWWRHLFASGECST